MSAFLEHAVVLLLAAVVTVPLFRKAGLGAVLGYIAAGILIGPSVLGLFTDVDDMLHFSEFGVVLLLFIIGLELQFSRLRALRHPIFVLGTLQVLACALLLGLGLRLFADQRLVNALVIGSALALSSTAFVLQLLAEKKQLTAAYGRLSFAILLFQDLAVIPLLAVLPILAGVKSGATGPVEWLLELGHIVLVFAALVFMGRFVLRHVLRIVHASGVREIAIGAALLVVTGVAFLMEQLNLSMALGAFVAGVLLADSEYRHELEADLDPFKGLLLGMFFISVGMGLGLEQFLASPARLFGYAVLLIAVKFLVIFLVGRFAGGLDRPAAIRLGLLLGQGGEFGFVVFSAAGQLGMLGETLRSELVMVVTLSMILTPLLYGVYGKWLAPRLEARATQPYDSIEEEGNGVVIAGFGRFGQITGRLLRTLDIGFTALDISPAQVDVVRRFGNKVHYGDAARLDVLRAAGLGEARILVLAIDDVDASLQTVRLVRRHFPQVKILARARNRKHAHLLMDLGVAWIIRETLLSALRTAEETLIQLGRSAGEARTIVEKFRTFDEESLRRQHAVHTDDKRFLQTAREAAEELHGLMEEDRKAPGGE